MYYNYAYNIHIKYMVVLYKNGLVISIARVASFSERLNSHHRSAPLKFSYEQINFEILLKIKREPYRIYSQDLKSMSRIPDSLNELTKVWTVVAKYPE